MDSVMAWEKRPYGMPVLQRQLDVFIYLYLLAFSIEMLLILPAAIQLVVGDNS